MHPIKFPEVNGTLMPVKGTDQGKLPICKTEKGWISCWRLSFTDRIRAVIFGRVWIYTLSPKFQYPVSMACIRNMFTKVKGHISSKRTAHQFPKRRRHDK